MADGTTWSVVLAGVMIAAVVCGLAIYYSGWLDDTAAPPSPKRRRRRDREDRDRDAEA